MSSTKSVSLIREFKAESGHKVRLALDSQVLRLKNDRLDDADEMPLNQSLASILENKSKPATFVSAGALIVKAKQFDDGFLATLEESMQNGQGNFKGKQKLLEALAKGLLQNDVKPSQRSYCRAAVTLFSALSLSGSRKVKLSDEWQAKVDERLEQFKAQEIVSRPVSFYTWNKKLEKIFKQDRMLQTPLELSKDANGARALASIIKNDPDLLDSYLKQLDMLYKLTNSPRLPDLRTLFRSADSKIEIDAIAIMPPTVSHEEDLLAKLIGPGNPLPANFSLMDEFIKVVRSRKISLRPTSESGLYDYITWSLAPLIAPHLMVESEHLAIDEAYFELLEDLLRGTIALTRIAHARSLPEKEPLTSDAPAASQLKISPKISVEPLPTFYYRRAYSYRFLKSVASSLFGPDGLKKLRRMTPDGPVEVDLYSELTFMEDLFNGAHISSCKDLGMKPAQTPEASLAVFSLWAKKHFQDPDLARDQRMMVPISYDIESGLSKVWCFLGWRKEELIVSFEKPPEVEVFDKDGRKLARRDLWLRPRAPVNKADANKVEESDEISYSFEPAVFAGYYPVMEELYVKDILERSEFQKLCDKHKALSKIVKALTPR